MKQLVLEKIVISPFAPMNKRCLWLKGNTFHYWYNGAWRSIDSDVDINNEYIDEKVTEVVSETINEEIKNIVGNAPEEFDTLEEIAQYASDHEAEAEERDANIKANTAAIKELEEKVANGGVPSAWEGFES